MGQVIGLLGGTFNPVHNGHVYLVKKCLEEYTFDRFLVVPSGNAYHKLGKQKILSGSHRFFMCQLAFKWLPQVEVVTFELEKTGPTRTYHTLTELKALYPGSHLLWLLGSDSFCTIDQWYRYQEVLQLATFIVVMRGTDTRSEIEARNASFKFPAHLLFLNSLNSPISSTYIRHCFRCRQDVPKGWLPNDVMNYIKRHHLYNPLTKGVYDY
ncbi:MAG: nicotinate (nicotinamide) nucleotide adenylyltransferase [Neisseriaceae bacterium]